MLFLLFGVLILRVVCYCVGVRCLVAVEYIGVGWCVVVAHLSLCSLFVGYCCFVVVSGLLSCCYMLLLCCSVVVVLC